MKSNKKAFTLIELLVVIAIIGILVTIAVIALNSARSKARDAKRVANIKQVQTALELFFNDKNRYPTLSEYNSGALYSTSSFNGTTTYMEIVPEAPTPPDGNCTNNQNQFSYTPTNNGGSYTISYCLGNPTGSIAEGPHCATPSTIAGGACDGSGGSTGGCVQDSDCNQINNEFCCADQSGATCAYQTCVNQITYDGGPISGKYDVVYIGAQYWLKQNLNVGSKITSCVGGAVLECDYNCSDYGYSVNYQSNDNNIEKYCYNDSDNECNIYGGLYEWAEAMGLPESCNNISYICTNSGCDAAGSICDFSFPRQGICPAGWHIPSDSLWGDSSDWRDLEMYLEPSCDRSYDPSQGCAVAYMMREAGITHWINDPGATNSSGLSVLPSGIRYLDGSFCHHYELANLITSLPDSNDSANYFYRHIYSDEGGFDRYSYGRLAGRVIRCIKD